MATEDNNSIFSLFPKHTSVLGNWEEEVKKYAEKVSIERISGTVSVKIGESYLYTATEFNPKVFSVDEVETKIQWEYSIDDKTLIVIPKEFQNHFSIVWKIPKNTGKKITVYAWILGTEKKARFDSFILQGTTINREVFFRKINTAIFKNKISAKQRDGITTILDWRNQYYPFAEDRFLAYMLATVLAETTTFEPKEESEASRENQDYNSKLKYERYKNPPQNRIPYETPDQLYYGRGLVQPTWYEVYETASKALKIDFMNHPEKALDLGNALHIMFLGMMKGWFTGKKLSDYFNKTTDWVNARKIINKLNRAEEIADNATKFYEAMLLSEEQNLPPEGLKLPAQNEKNITAV